jgi:hypothetical protein
VAVATRLAISGEREPLRRSAKALLRPWDCERVWSLENVVIATEWKQFRALDLDRLRAVMARPVIVDLRNIYRAEEMKRANFRDLAVGRPTAERQVENSLPRRRKAAANGRTVGGKVLELPV